MAPMFQIRKLKIDNVSVNADGQGWCQGLDRCLTPELVLLTTVLLPQFVIEEAQTTPS